MLAQGKTVKILEAVDALVAMVWDGKVVVTESGNSGDEDDGGERTGHGQESGQESGHAGSQRLK